ncbi:MAG: UDP-N-acetylmuramoyl-L-alanine--D-glutamate ligase [Planctomycetia bacterium]|nr:UDP-N-acetylmuramoyl-L-alanine--D-glutamate ligase [Planctomycetia bacterium]
MAHSVQSAAKENSIRARNSRASDFLGRRVTVMGLGRHGGSLAAARYLAIQGAQVTISDVADGAALAESLAQLQDLPIAAVKLGGHDLVDFAAAEFVVVNPAVRPEHPCLQLARASGAALTSEIELFLDRCPGKVIGITGSNGKSTTSSMLAEILKAAGRRTWLGGNIGRSLLGELNQMTTDDWVVLELSSFQLAHLNASLRLPQFAVVTNCSPNHLDWHGSYAAYVWAKRRLVAESSAAALVVLNDHDPLVASWAALARGLTLASWPLERIPPLPVPGVHNRQNAACAAAAAEAAGVDRATICRTLVSFRGLDHRLQFVAEVSGRRFFNDSKSTTPQATMAALASLEGPIWLLAGGHSKGANFAELAAAIVSSACGAGLFGAARESLQSSLHATDAAFNSLATERLADALEWCWRQSKAGDSILLSPACASYDQFRDFVERGEVFGQLVRGLGRGATK